MPVRLPVPMVLLEPVRVLLGDGVIVPVALLEPVCVLLGVGVIVPVRVLLGDGVIVPVPVALLEPVHVLLAVMVDESEGVGMESNTGRHGSATPPDENEAGIMDWPS